MTEHLNRRTFIGLFTGIAAFLGFTQKAKAEKPYTEEELEAPSRPMLSNANFHESGKAYGMVDRLTFPDKALVPKKPAVFDDHERKRQEEINLKTSAFLICPQCGNDMHWARCECGFVWTNRVDEVAGGGQGQYDVKPVEYPAGIADTKTLVVPFRPNEAEAELNALKAAEPTTALIPETQELKLGFSLGFVPSYRHIEVGDNNCVNPMSGHPVDAIVQEMVDYSRRFMVPLSALVNTKELTITPSDTFESAMKRYDPTYFAGPAI